uniref:Uncharacterized protein n=1 Tax=viral metagenome TaxID=1070528 RepID=A0A6C0CAM5_9ZZZZ
MITDDIDAIESIITTQNINIIKLLCTNSCLSRDNFVSALQNTRYDHKFIRLSPVFVSKLLDVADEYFGGLYEQDVLDHLLMNILMDRSDDKIMRDCCLRLINDKTKFNSWVIVNLPEDIFFDYVVTHDVHINDNMFSMILNLAGVNKNIVNWIVDKWISQDIPCDIGTAAYLLKIADNGEYFAQISQLFHSHNIYDAAILYNIIFFEFSLSQTSNFVASSMYSEELLLATKIMRNMMPIIEGNTMILIEEIYKMMQINSSIINLEYCASIMSKLTSLLQLL